MNKKYLLLGTGILVLLLIGYTFTSGNSSDNDEPSTSNTIIENPQSGVFFKLVDLQEIEYQLTDYKGAPVLVHFMAVGCGGQYSQLNDNQLKQLKMVCENLCEERRISIFTILVSTCDTTDLSQLYEMYNITWVMGNDYQDNKLDIVEKFSEYEPEDGMIVILDQQLTVNDVKKGSISATNLIEEILQMEN